MRLNTQINALLEAFERGETLTANSAFNLYKVATFSQRICDIETLGFRVDRCAIPHSRRYQYWITADQFKRIA